MSSPLHHGQREDGGGVESRTDASTRDEDATWWGCVKLKGSIIQSEICDTQGLSTHWWIVVASLSSRFEANVLAGLAQASIKLTVHTSLNNHDVCWPGFEFVDIPSCWLFSASLD
jgi:hypothetical protein